MRVSIEIVGFDKFSDLFGGKRFEIDFHGMHIKDLLEDLTRKYGQRLQKLLYDDHGSFDPMIQIVLNGKDWVPASRHGNTSLHEGDTISLVALLAGG